MRGTVGFLVTDGMDQNEFAQIWQALDQAGADPVVVSSRPDRVRARLGETPGHYFTVHRPLAGIDLSLLRGVVVPGGLAHADVLRTDPAAVGLVRDALAREIVVGLHGHALWLLTEVALHDRELVAGRRVTGAAGARTDLVHAGLRYLDVPVSVDGALVTGREAGDLPAYCTALAGLLEPPA